MSGRHKKIIVWGLPLLILLIAVAVLAAAKEAVREEPAAPEPAANPFGIYSPGSLVELPTTSGRLMIDTLGVDSYGAYQDFNIQLATDIGIGWVRVDFDYNGWGFVEPVDYLEKLRGSGLEVVGCARPQMDFVPADLQSFQVNLRHLVERYPWIRTWQIGNEPNISFRDPDDFPRFFVAGRDIVREVCPDCRVMLAGVASRVYTKEYARNVYDAVLGRITEGCTGTCAFDIFDMHFYGTAGSDGEFVANVEEYRRLLSKHGLGEAEVWLTESATYTGRIAEPDNAPVQTEQDQAADLVRRFTISLASGIARVSWARPYENFSYAGLENGFFDNTGLVYNGLGQEAALGIKAGTKKMAWYAYRTLVSKVDGYESITVHAPGVYEFGFPGAREPVIVLWDGGAGASPAQALPEWARGDVVVTDLTGAETRARGADLTPGAMPVFVERG